MDPSGLPRLLIAAGAALMAAGVLLWLALRLPGLCHLGRLPGDLLVERGGTTLYVPIVTSILLSIVLTIAVNLILRR